MKKIIASAGLVAVGAVTLNAQDTAARMETTKPWSVSAAFRGFYDDNINTEPGRFKTDSWGYEISPSGAVHYEPTEQTRMRLEYIYSYKYFEGRSENKDDQSHAVNAKLEHQFSPIYKLIVDDSFVYAQEPEVVETVQSIPVVRRNKSDVLRNRGAIEFDAKVTDRATVMATYQNTLYDYDFKEYQALLNRIEHLMGLEGRWQLQESLHVLAGYNFGLRDFTSSDLLPGQPLIGGLKGEDRSSSSHYLYGGATKELTTQLKAIAKVGAQYTVYDDALDTDNTWNPYADLSLTYTYLPGSYLQVGFTQARNATDVVQPNPNNSKDITSDAESSTLYAQVTHRITPALSGSLLGQYQHSTFRGGAFNDEADDLLLFGVNLTYTFTEHWSTEVGYNWDRLYSDVPDRGFSRNRVYLGVRASF